MAEQVGRKLAAILVSDVVGYSRLAGRDEELTLARLRALRSDLIDPIIAVHRGRIVKRTGDGALVEFRSVVDAVRGAIEVQSGLVERNAGLPPERRIEFRIGIHLGDVMEEADGDLMGDGVNIAARLEAICAPGGVVLSEDAYRQVRNRFDLAVTDLGDQPLKNIAEPVRVYAIAVGQTAEAMPAKSSQINPSPPSGGEGRVRGDAPSQPTPPRAEDAGRSLSPQRAQRGKRHSAIAIAAALIVVGALAAWYFVMRSGANIAASVPAHLSLVVLPFQNLSGDPKQDYLADVLTDELTTYISRLPGAFVIARNTAFTYKGKPTDAKEIGKELGVRYMLEGSVQPTDKRVRTNAQLIDTGTGAHLWAEEFDNDKGDLLDTQDQIVTRLARTLQLQLSDIEAAKLQRVASSNAEAQELSLRCEVATWSRAYGKQANEGYALCEKALALDPNNVIALATLASKYYVRVITRQAPDKKADVARADELASRATATAPNSPDAHSAKAGVLIAQGRYEEAGVEAERAIAINPSQMNAYNSLCIIGLYTGEPNRVIACNNKALRLSPRDPVRYVWMSQIGGALVRLGRNDEAIDWFRKTLAINPNYAFIYLSLAAELERGGHETEAHDYIERYLALPGIEAHTIAALQKDAPPSFAKVTGFYDALRKAGLPEQ